MCAQEGVWRPGVPGQSAHAEGLQGRPCDWPGRLRLCCRWPSPQPCPQPPELGVRGPARPVPLPEVLHTCSTGAFCRWLKFGEGWPEAGECSGQLVSWTLAWGGVWGVRVLAGVFFQQVGFFLKSLSLFLPPSVLTTTFDFVLPVLYAHFGIVVILYT